MIRLGLVNAIRTHAYVFSCIFNGGDENDWPGSAWKPESVTHIDDVRIVKVWDASRRDAELLASTCNIDQVVDGYEQVAEGVDAVILCDNVTLKHSEHAMFFLENDVPMFVDKPLADTVDRAEAVIGYARQHDRLMMSSSALRYAAEIERFREQLPALGQVRTAMATGRAKGRVINYGIHTIEMLHSVIGPGVATVHCIGEENKQVIKLGYEDGRVFVIVLGGGLPWQMAVFGENGIANVGVEDHSYYYYNLMSHFVRMVRTRRRAVPLEHTLEVIRIALAAERSLETALPIAISDMRRSPARPLVK